MPQTEPTAAPAETPAAAQVPQVPAAAPGQQPPTEATVAAYVRVSTTGQNLDGQKAEIQRWLTGNDIAASAVRWYVDHGATGDNLNRPAFVELQAAVFAGSIRTVVVF